jgi:2-oxoglutarate dehydrogenase E2 component (dihydrolipoamide succinyltransferase)
VGAPQEGVEVRVPAEQAEGTRSQVLRWLKAVGESVRENEPLIELETDKVTVEIAAPAAGVLAEILKGEQEEVAPGELLGRIAPSLAARPSDAASAVPAIPPAHGGGARSGQTSAASPASGPLAAAASGAARASAGALSPAVRRLLRENTLDPAAIAGSGEDGRITVADVMSAIAARGARPAARAGGTAPSAPAAPETVEGASSHRVPLSPVRKRIARHMVESLLQTAPHVTTVFEVDMGAVLADRERRREAFAASGVALTLTAYFARALVEAIRAVPQANSRWHESELEVFDTVNLGIGTAAESGLVVPVLKQAETLDLMETARRINDLVARAREGKLAPAEVRGGTFTMSNHGVSGSLLAAPIIINQPQSAILGLGKLEKRAVVIEEGGEERIVARPRCYATLTLDHRVMDGSEANRFMRVFCERVSEWRT